MLCLPELLTNVSKNSITAKEILTGRKIYILIVVYFPPAVIDIGLRNGWKNPLSFGPRFVCTASVTADCMCSGPAQD